MQVNRESPVPMWHQIELSLARDIQAGQLAAGARLPAEAEIAARFGVHRHTARRALAALADKGAVRIRRGLGTFVEEAVIDYPISERTRFTANLQQQNRLASHDLLEALDQPAPGLVAEALALAPATPVTLLHTLGRADGVPISIGWSYFPAARFPRAGGGLSRTPVGHGRAGTLRDARLPPALHPHRGGVADRGGGELAAAATPQPHPQRRKRGHGPGRPAHFVQSGAVRRGACAARGRVTRLKRPWPAPRSPRPGGG